MKKEHMIVLGLGLALVGAAVAWEVVGGLQTHESGNYQGDFEDRS